MGDGSRNNNGELRVLVAEDEALIRIDLVEMLKEEGYDVVGEAADGQSAVDLAISLRPGVVIMDVKMPVRDGIDAARELARERIAPVVILTAFSQREMVVKARDAGALAYLVKPFTQADLAPAIELAVSRFEELIALEKEVFNLQERLEARKIIDKAKGVLMDSQKLSEAEAFKWLQRSAMDKRETMKAVSLSVIATHEAQQQAKPPQSTSSPTSTPRPFKGSEKDTTASAEHQPKDTD